MFLEMIQNDLEKTFFVTLSKFRLLEFFPASKGAYRELIYRLRLINNETLVHLKMESHINEIVSNSYWIL